MKPSDRTEGNARELVDAGGGLEHIALPGLRPAACLDGIRRGRDLLRVVAPGFDALCARWVEQGRNVGSMTARTVKLHGRISTFIVTLPTARPGLSGPSTA